MYYYSDGETQVCLLSAIEMLGTESVLVYIVVRWFCSHFLAFNAWIQFLLDFRLAPILFCCNVKPLREIAYTQIHIHTYKQSDGVL